MYMRSVDIQESLCVVKDEIDAESKAWCFGLSPITGVLSVAAASVAVTAGAPIAVVAGAAAVSLGFAAATGAMIYNIIFD